MAKNVSELSSNNFKEFISKGTAIVDFWAPWCGPCKMMAPIFEEISKELKDKIKFGKVNVDDEPELAQEFDVMSIPTLIIFKNGEQLDRLIGLMDKKEILEKIDELL